VFQLFKLEHF